MRVLTFALGLLAFAGPARADACGDLIDRVVAATQASLVKRSADFAELSGPDSISMTLACGDRSAVGAQFRGPTLPEGYFPLFGRAGQAVTGVPADAIAAAAVKARDSAVATRHSKADAGTALVTCSISTPNGGPVTACAAIDRGDER